MAKVERSQSKEIKKLHSSLFLGWILVISLLPIVVIAYLTFAISQSSLHNETSAHLATITDKKKLEIANYIAMNEHDIEILTITPSIIDLANAINVDIRNNTYKQDKYEPTYQKLSPFLNSFLEKDYLSDIYLLTPTGKLTFALIDKSYINRNYTMPPYNKTDLAKVFNEATTLLQKSLSDFKKKPNSNLYEMYLAAPVFDKGKIIAVVVFKLTDKGIAEVVNERAGFGNTEETIVGAKLGDKIVVAIPPRDDGNSSGMRDASTTALSPNIVSSMQKAFLGVDGEGTIKDAQGKDVMAVWRYIPSLRWAILVKTDADEVFAPILHLRTSLIIISIMTILIVAFIAFFIVRKINKTENDLTNLVTDLEVARDKANEANASKSQFLANMSHELRTPMNAILGMINLTLDSNLTEEQRDYLGTANSSSSLLLALLNDLLDIAKIESGGLELEKINFNLYRITEDVMQLFVENAGSKDIELSIHIDENVPEWLKGDPTRLRQVLSNFISNAVKFTGTGGHVILKVKLVNAPNGIDLIRYEIVDTGIGISQDVQDRLFKPFVQADSSTTRKYGGSGLGLALCKQLVNSMGGETGVISEEGKGSTFWFTTKLEPGEELEEFTPAPELNQLQLLIIDDNEMNRKVLHRQCAAWINNIQEAESGHQALDLLRTAKQHNQPYDIAIINMTMPEMDGIELTRIIKSDLSLSACHVIMLSSSIQTEIAEEAKKFGASAYLVKPVSKVKLYNSILRSLDLNQYIAHREVGLDKPIEKLNINPKARILLVEDHAINRKVACAMLKRFGLINVDIAINGKEAVDLQQENNHYDLILMDCQMPIMSGYDATKEIRSHEQEGHHTPIIALTALAFQSDIEKCIAVGMDDYLSKPIQIGQLLEKLQKWVGYEREEKNEVPSEGLKETTEAPTHNEVTSNKILNAATLEQVHSIFGKDIIGIIDEFLNDTEKKLAEMQQASIDQNAANLNFISHKIKSLSGTLGALTLSEKLKEIELQTREGSLRNIDTMLKSVVDEFIKVKKELEEFKSKI